MWLFLYSLISHTFFIMLNIIRFDIFLFEIRHWSISWRISLRNPNFSLKIRHQRNIGRFLLKNLGFTFLFLLFPLFHLFQHWRFKIKRCNILKKFNIVLLNHVLWGLIHLNILNFGFSVRYNKSQEHDESFVWVPID